MIDRLQRIAAWLLNLFHVNELERCVLDGTQVLIKRRRPGAFVVIWFGNRFLTFARSGISMLVRADDWVSWEIDCAHRLYPQRREVTKGSGASVILPEVRGMSLRQFLRGGSPGMSPFVAAARELRRVHAIRCPHFGDAWSHGDLHLDNILYDEASDQIVLIDFDVRHDAERSTTWRHSDDLKVMLLELISQPDEQWPDRARVLIEGYGNKAVLLELDRQLFVPRGFAKILWHYRTGGFPTHELIPRLEGLRSLVQRAASATDNAITIPDGQKEGG